jgi:hypothetical protein
MVNKRFKRGVVYFAALMAVCFGMEWGFSYILHSHGEQRSKKRQAAEASP